MPKKLLIGLLILVAAGATTFLYIRMNNRTANEAKPTTTAAGFNKSQYSLADPTSIWVVVNKTRPLPSDFVPPDLTAMNVTKRTDKSPEELQLRAEAANHMSDLFSAATADGINFTLGSAYRSYALQKLYHDNYAAHSGEAEANKFSAEPGKSEHQTGLAADLGAANGKCYLETCFGDSPEGKWLAANAYNYGFIIRYPKGKEAITGYEYEPWHIRYVGTDLAKQIQDTGQTLEEFFELN